MIRWVIITGEYPPEPGGVSDYTQAVARALAAAGDEVHVFAPRWEKDDPPEAGISMYRLPDCFGRASLRLLDEHLRSIASPFRMLVQYVPHAYGYKAMNVGFAWWLYRRRHRMHIEIMFHEVQYPARWRQPLRRNFLAAVNRLMAGLITRSARCVFISIPAWEGLIKNFVRRPCPIIWAPVPSNTSLKVDPAACAARKAELTRGRDVRLIGHFGTYGPEVSAALRPILVDLLARGEDRMVVLIGRSSDHFLAEFAREHPQLEGRIHATGGLSPDQLSSTLAACDMLVQVYPDGVSCRRGSLMASVALGLPVVANASDRTEPIWLQKDAVVLSSDADPESIARLAESLLADPIRRQQLGANAARLYREHFDLVHTIEVLRESDRGLGK